MKILDILASPWLHMLLGALLLYVAYRLYWKYVYFDRCVAYRHPPLRNGLSVIRLVMVEDAAPAYIMGMLRDRDYRILSPDECRLAVSDSRYLGSIWDHVLSMKDGRYYESMLRSGVTKPMEIRSDKEARDKLVFATKNSPTSSASSRKKSALPAAA